MGEQTALTVRAVMRGLGATFLRGVRNIAWFCLVAGGVVLLVWGYVAMCRNFPALGWGVSGCLVVLWVGAVWND